MTYETLTLLFVVNAVLMMLAARVTESVVAVCIFAGANAYLLAMLIREATQ